MCVCFLLLRILMTLFGFLTQELVAFSPEGYSGHQLKHAVQSGANGSFLQQIGPDAESTTIIENKMATACVSFVAQFKTQ